MLADMGQIVYDIRAGEKNWAGLGNEATCQRRMGFLPPNAPKEWLSIIVHVTNSVNPADLPAKGLSLYENGRTRLAGEGAWYLVRCTLAGNIKIVELSTKPPVT